VAEIAEGPLAGGAVLPLAELLERAGESAPLHPPVSLEIDAGLAAQPRQLRFFFGIEAVEVRHRAQVDVDRLQGATSSSAA